MLPLGFDVTLFYGTVFDAGKSITRAIGSRISNVRPIFVYV